MGARAWTDALSLDIPCGRSGLVPERGDRDVLLPLRPRGRRSLHERPGPVSPVPYVGHQRVSLARITSLHHVTSIVGDAQEDLDFYAGRLGLRLLKRTVNFDDTSVFHFYYGDGVGTPSTIMTTFPYTGRGMSGGQEGAGQITRIAFSAPPGSLAFWKGRLDEAGHRCGEFVTDFGEEGLSISDPSRLALELVEGEDDVRTKPWTPGGIETEVALRGLHHITLTVRSPERSADFLTQALGFEVAGDRGSHIRLGVAERGPGQLVELVPSQNAPTARNGLGTVHHVAFSVPTDEAQLEFREKLLSMGWPVTEVRDRQYFRSIYFPEPGGVLFEIATAGPGFAIDEAASRLGGALKLPPWEEPNRGSIEEQLPAVRPP
ncbi:MAG: ring-cleaving dioxygenase [Gemmatimonadetes bacterium]|nr:ring-cleaving dioxygenase [Gemmatimonadota bacterium]